MTWNTLPDMPTIERTITALKSHGIEAEVVSDGASARAKLLSLIPKGSKVLHSSSVTLETIGVIDIVNDSGQYDSIKNALTKLDRTTQRPQMLKLGASPEYIIGSVHAVTETGEVFIASRTGSQLAGYVYGAQQVIWVVGTQKIVKLKEDAFSRIYDYVLPLEDKHMLDLYGMHSEVAKLLIINKEVVPNRIHLIFVPELLGF